jgi:catechol 2,3-dioxygenase-like lactoylglutathione lyase family enzyme
MIDHTGIGVANVARSAAFYDAAVGALGLRRVMQLPENDGPAASALASITLFSGLTVSTYIV